MKIQDLTNQVTGLKTKNKKLSEDNAKLKFELDNSELVKFPILAAKLNKVKDKAKTRKADLGDLDFKIRVAERTILNLKEDNDHVSEVKKTLETKVNNLVDALEKEGTSKKEVETKMQELEDILVRKESEYQKKLKIKDEEWEILNKNWEEISKLYDENNEIISNNKLDIDKLQGELKEETRKNGEYSKLAVNLQKQIDQKNEEIDKERENIDKLESDIEALQIADKDREETIRIITVEKEQIQIQKEDLQNSYNDLGIQLTNLQVLLKKKDDEGNKKISDLKDELNKKLEEEKAKWIGYVNPLTYRADWIDPTRNKLTEAEMQHFRVVDKNYKIWHDNYEKSWEKWHKRVDPTWKKFIEFAKNEEENTALYPHLVPANLQTITISELDNIYNGSLKLPVIDAKKRWNQHFAYPVTFGNPASFQRPFNMNEYTDMGKIFDKWRLTILVDNTFR